jgi:hypothetical protein
MNGTSCCRRFQFASRRSWWWLGDRLNDSRFDQSG